MYHPFFIVNPHVWVRTRAWFPPIIEDDKELKNFAMSLISKSSNSTTVSDGLINDIVASFGGCLLHYQELLSANKAVPDVLKAMKIKHTQHLKKALNFKDGQRLSSVGLERYELLQRVVRGEKIVNTDSEAAEYLLSKHGNIEAFLGIHPDGHLFLAVPMTKQSMKEIEESLNQGRYFFWWK